MSGDVSNILIRILLISLKLRGKKKTYFINFFFVQSAIKKCTLVKPVFFFKK